jgi:hypothetical protein
MNSRHPIGKRVERKNKPTYKNIVGTITDIQFSIMPFIVTWDDGGVIAYSKDELIEIK